MSVLSRLPILRLLIPFAIGIVLYSTVSHWWLPSVLVLCAVAAMVVMRFLGTTPQASLRMRQFRIVPLSVFVVAVGWIAALIADPPVLQEGQLSGRKVCAHVETIKYNEKSELMQVKLLHDLDGSKKKSFYNTHFLLSTRGCDYGIKAGDLLAFDLNLGRVRNMGNPDEMDYARYLHDKGIIYRQHIDVRELERVGRSPTLMTRAFNYRQLLEHKLLSTSMSPSAQSLVIAVLLGNDDFIEPAMRESFSQAGVAHVLALSGLHVAIISMIIWFLLFPLDYLGGKKLRLVLTLLILIGYDVFTGLSPSVIRATVMIAFVFLSVIFYRKSSPLNAVAAAALAILVFSPFSLYSVGFQLSFITVFSLIIFYTLLDIKHPSNKALNYFYSTLLTSVVAMLSTIILTAYYFNTVSLVSVLSNIVIMPLLPVFMVIGAVVIVMLAMGGDGGFLCDVLDGLVRVINCIVEWFSTLPLARGDVYVTWVAVVVYYAVLVLLALWLYRRKVKMLLAAGVVLIIGLVHSMVVDVLAPSRGLVIFNSFNSTPVLYYNGSYAMLWVPDVENDFDMENFKRWNRAFIAHHHIDSLKLVDSTLCELPGAVIDPPYANVMGTGIVAAGKGKWKRYTRDDSLNMRFDVALITKGYHSQVATLKELVACDTIILSGGIYDDDNSVLEKECSDLNTPYYNIKRQGAFTKVAQ